MMTSAGREVLKWLALVLMTGDHVNKVLFAGQLPWLTEIARVVFPIFAVVLAYNLSQHPSPEATRRALTRMLVFAVLAQPFHAWAFGYWLPVNVLFTLALGVYVATARPWWLSAIAFVVASGFVDYQWFGVAVVVAAFWFWRMPAKDQTRLFAAGVLVAAVASLYVINGNWIALAAFPLLWMLGRLPGRVPRWRWTFVAYYFLHLVVLAVSVPTLEGRHTFFSDVGLGSGGCPGASRLFASLRCCLPLGPPTEGHRCRQIAGVGHRELVHFLHRSATTPKNAQGLLPSDGAVRSNGRSPCA